MNCPHCNAKAKLSETLRVSRWKNYTCQSCGKDSTFTLLNSLSVYALMVFVATVIMWIAQRLGFNFSLLLYFVLLTLALYPSKALLGKLVPVGKTDG